MKDFHTVAHCDAGKTIASLNFRLLWCVINTFMELVDYEVDLNIKCVRKRGIPFIEQLIAYRSGDMKKVTL